jgi:2-phospho-L-lactate guanylyltransferase
MSLWVIIPVKPLKRAKSRLSTVLSPEQRYQFSEAMFRRVLDVTTHIPQVAGTLVVSRDTKALAIAREYGAKTIQESGTPELNPALLRATQVVRSWNAQAVLILPADLPFLDKDDLLQLIDKGKRGPCIVIAPDNERNGTNALLVRPAGLIEYAYGEGSYMRHIRIAREAGAEVYVYQSERLLLDIDLPQDLEAYNRLVETGHYTDLPVFSPDGAN